MNKKSVISINNRKKKLKFVFKIKNSIFAVRFFKDYKIKVMSRVCQLTGKKAIVGNKVSHSNAKTKRKFNANLVVKKFFIPETEEWITLKVSTSALKNIYKKGITACLQEAQEKGFLKF